MSFDCLLQNNLEESLPSTPFAEFLQSHGNRGSGIRKATTDILKKYVGDDTLVKEASLIIHVDYSFALSSGFTDALSTVYLTCTFCHLCFPFVSSSALKLEAIQHQENCQYIYTNKNFDEYLTESYLLHAIISTFQCFKEKRWVSVCETSLRFNERRMGLSSSLTSPC